MILSVADENLFFFIQIHRAIFLKFINLFYAYRYSQNHSVKPSHC